MSQEKAKEPEHRRIRRENAEEALRASEAKKEQSITLDDLLNAPQPPCPGFDDIDIFRTGNR